MRTRRRTEITVETRRVLYVRRGRPSEEVRCPVCPGMNEMLTTEEAAGVSGLTERALFRRVEAGRLHSAETPDGRLFVCLVSLREGSG